MGFTPKQMQYGLYAIAAMVLFWPAIKAALAKAKSSIPSIPVPWGDGSSSHDHEHFTPDDVLRFAMWLKDHGNPGLAKQLAELPTSYYVCPDDVKKLEPCEEDCDRDPDTDP